MPQELTDNARIGAQFERAAKEWEERAERNPQEATPDAFTRFFGAAEQGGCFTNEKEALKAIDKIAELIETQRWDDAAKDSVLDTYRKMGAGAEIEAARPAYSDSLWGEEVASWNPLDEFRPQGMGRNVCFRRGTFNIIGARPGCGKTTFAIKLLADAIEWREDSRVIFLSFEEEPKDVYTRLYSHLIFAKAKRAGRLSEIQGQEPYRQIYRAVKYPDSGGPLNRDLDWARTRARELEQAGRLMVRDFDGGSIEEIEQALRLYPRAVVIIDYLQLIEAAAGFAGNELAGLKDISKRLASIAKKKKQIIIALAQLKRCGQQDAGDSDKPSQLTVDRLKDCGQFEQDAATVIELGMSTDWGEEARKEHDRNEPFYFWKIVKNRKQGGRNQCCLFNTAGGAMGWSYMEGTEESAAFLDYSKPKAKGKKEEPQGGATGNAEKKGAAKENAGFLNSSLFKTR